MTAQLVKLPEVTAFPKVRAFLDSKARNSAKTGHSYREGLQRMAAFISEAYPERNIETIISEKVDVYRLLDGFISYMTKQGLGVSTIKLAIAAARSYLQMYDIEITPGKFKHKVTMPKERKEDEYALDIKEIRTILTAINNRRLKAFCMVLASGGMRPVEALAIQVKNIDFKAKPTKIYMKAEYSKNKLPREIYITSEATRFLNQWLAHKYRNKKPDPEELVFSVMGKATPEGLYPSISNEFRAVLKAVNFDERKKGLAHRGKITLYSFRRYVKTTIEDHTGHSMSEYILGHKKSPYYTKKEHERRTIYAKSCERYLTFLDYTEIDQQLENEKETISQLESRLTSMEVKYLEEKKKNALQVDDIIRHLTDDTLPTETRTRIEAMFEGIIKKVVEGKHLP